jgi:hypothetical protein
VHVVFRRNDSVEAAKIRLYLSVFGISVVLCFVALAVKAITSSRRLDAHRHYVEGYRQGRANAMFEQEFQPRSGSLLPEEFSEEYQRGYRDGYKLLNH